MNIEEIVEKLKSSAEQETFFTDQQKEIIEKYLKYSFVAGIEYSYGKNKGGAPGLKIRQLDKKGDRVEDFDTIRDAANSINGWHQNISKCLAGKRKSHKGYYWVYVRV